MKSATNAILFLAKHELIKLLRQHSVSPVKENMFHKFEALENI